MVPVNQSDPDAQTLLYSTIPNNYVYDSNNRKRRKRGGNKIVARMYMVNAKDVERFYLRMLLLHVPGATSFKFLRTVDNFIYDTFKQYAFYRHFLNSDEEWDPCSHDASTYQMPKQVCASVTRLRCSSCGTNTRSKCLSIICATASKQLL
ncbi:hypothetical protein AVEN_56949-1 [Araneus ventricosus]|uniref:PiggyBac transposable element-derived protein domain-containing protein n=1 Tax=Araneus ventricosus TaxID=182803 RepID=A0A4Y2ETK5_ARAVE|nr:hypothetical protein AVEN_56949-1 [Araneus ventricosus]